MGSVVHAGQLPLDFAPPRPRQVETPAARRTDPNTSHLAAEQHTASGKRGQQQAQAIAAVRAFPGMTSFELAMRTNLDRYMLARRLPECVTAGPAQGRAPYLLHHRTPGHDLVSDLTTTRTFP